MADQLALVKTLERDRLGRPLVIPPDGGKPTAYTRCTTYVSAIEDTYNITRWKQRMVMLGVGEIPYLATTRDPTNKSSLDSAVDVAFDAGARVEVEAKLGLLVQDLRTLGFTANSSAEIGDAMHALTERMDRGELPEINDLPPVVRGDLLAYQEAVAEFKMLHIEAFCVADKLKVGGTPDRIMEFQGESYIGDLKTGSIDLGTLKIAMQLSMYAHSRLYDPATGERANHHASPNRGIVIHLPAGQGVCTLHWVDLEAGWHAIHVVGQVRDQRKLSFKQLTEPFGEPSRPSLHAVKTKEAAELELAESERASLAKRINASDDPDIIRGLWANNQDVWDDSLTEKARARIAILDDDKGDK